MTEKMIAAFRKGSKPKQAYEEEEIESLKKLLTTTAERMESDYNDSIFTTYKEYTTSYGFTIKSIEDAIDFNNTHEAMHLGWMLAMKRLV